MKLTLIRHGITQGNKEGLYYGATDLPLLDEGVAELQRRKLEFVYPAAQRYYTSTLQRTQQTLRELYGEVEFTPVSGLREMNFGIFEMRAAGDLRQDPQVVAWQQGDVIHQRCPGGESFGDVHVRALEAITPILASDEDTVCVVHGGVIGCLMVTWFPEKSFEAWMPHPGTGWQVTVENGKPVSYVPAPFEPV